jgi:glycosyltransferase involved in cell wall biosynthesis
MNPQGAQGPTVSALIDNYNYERYLGAAIESVLAQSYPVSEIVICDDGSTDGSCEMAERYAALDRRIKLVRKENGGQGSAFNAAFAASSGEILCLLDSDDVWSPDKVARVVEIFCSVPETEWVCHTLRLTDDSLTPLRIAVPARRCSRRHGKERFGHMEKTIAFNTSVSVRRDLAERVFPIPEEQFRRAADLYIRYMCGVLRAPGYSLGEELGLYRRHPGQISRNGDDYRAAVEQEIVLTRAFLELQPCGGYVPTHVYKHAMISAYMHSGRILEPQRVRLCAAGLASAGRLLRNGCLRLALLQVAKLAYGFLLPGPWIRRQLRRSAWMDTSVQTSR